MKRALQNVLAQIDTARGTQVLISIGLIVRILALVMFGRRPLLHENPSYYEMALQLLGNKKFAPYWPPGVPYYFMLAHWVLGDGLFVARASMVIVYVGFSLALYALTKEFSTRAAANLVLLIFVFYPSYIRLAIDLSTEYPAAACLTTVVYLSLLVVRKRTNSAAAALGLLLGILALVRPSSLGLVVLIPLYVAFKVRRLRLALMPLLIPCILIGAWLWKAYTLAGRFVMINDSNAQNFFLLNNPYTPLSETSPDAPVAWVQTPKPLAEEMRQIESRPIEVQQQMYRSIALHYILSRPDLFLLRTFNRVRAYFGFTFHHGAPDLGQSQQTSWRRLLGIALTVIELCFYWPIMALAIIGCFCYRSIPIEKDSLIVILGAATVYSLPYWLTISQPRFIFPVVPLFGAIACALLASLIRRPWREVLEPLRHSNRRRRAMILTLIVFFCIQIEWVARGIYFKAY